LRYRYEDLGDEDFQRMVGAILAHLDQTVQLPPLGQTDGGFDAYRRVPGELLKIVGHQVKWTANPYGVKKPVSWVLSQLRSELGNLQRMVKDGTESYLIVTNVPGTSMPVRGRMDQADKEITKFGNEIGLKIYVWWRADLDGRVDSAPSELKFAYPNMLVGPDAMRAMLGELLQGGRLKQQTRLIRGAVSSAWEQDKNVGFRQGNLEGVPLDSLFVDVTARRTYDLGDSSRQQAKGALELLLWGGGPVRSMIFGAPGQGKSTLVQKLCQEHRRLILEPPSQGEFDERWKKELDTPRVPLKVVLRDYAQWLAGLDPFSPTEKKRPTRTTDSVESFVAHLLHIDSGGMTCTADDVVEIGSRFPTLFAFDGLDEVADVAVRDRAVREIEAFASRSDRWETRPKIVTTSRPSFSRLAEPSSESFVQFTLEAVSEKLRIEYLRNWARSQSLSVRDRHDVERIFRERSGQAHVRELATNPMQLTILLYLIHQRGDSVPQRRTALYQDYLQAFLDREASKSTVVKKYRDELEEITAFLGWHLQSRAEGESGNGRAAREDLIRETKHYLVDNGREALVSMADDLFTTMTERVWALTSRTTGTFEFDVQSIREYFAARYLFDRAPIPSAGSKQDVFARFREAARRPYWANTARLMAGLFRYGEKSHLADDLIEQIASGSLRFWPRRMALTLVRDGVFDDQPSPRLRLISASMDEIGVRVSVRDVDDGSAVPVAADRGGVELATELQRAIAGSAGKGIALERARLLSDYLTDAELLEWWLKVREEPMESSAWLEIGATLRVAPHLRSADLASLDRATSEDASVLLSMGVTPEKSSQLASTMISCVLSGMNSDVDSLGSSHAAALAHVVNLSTLVSRADTSIDESAPWEEQASKRLRSANPGAAERILRARRETGGQRGTTSMFATLADAVQVAYGRSWLANHVAIIGASASRLRMGHAAAPTDRAWGSNSVPSALIRDIRTDGSRYEWWQAQRTLLTDDIDRCTWVLAALTCAPRNDMVYLLDDLVEEVDRLDSASTGRLWKSASKLSLSADARALPATFFDASARRSLRLASLAIHFIADDFPLDPEQLSTIALNPAGDPPFRELAAHLVWKGLSPQSSEQALVEDALTAPNPLFRFFGSKSWPIPNSMLAKTTVNSPWATLEWANLSLEQSVTLSTLSAVADANRWFEPAN
jgi:hypothetical protein